MCDIVHNVVPCFRSILSYRSWQSFASLQIPNLPGWYGTTPPAPADDDFTVLRTAPELTAILKRIEQDKIP